MEQRKQIDEMTKDRLMQVVYNAICELELTEYEHERILEILDITEDEYQTIKKHIGE